MKKLIFTVSILSLILNVSCKNDVAPPPPVPATPVVVTPPATPPPAPEVAAEDATSTSVSVGKEGINVDSKKTKVTVDGTGAAVEVKK
jgi:hypothetical protein